MDANLYYREIRGFIPGGPLCNEIGLHQNLNRQITGKIIKRLIFLNHHCSFSQPGGMGAEPGHNELLEGPTAGSDSVVLAASNSWTATANDSWLHLSAANQSGTGSANVIFTFDANPGRRARARSPSPARRSPSPRPVPPMLPSTNVTTLVSSGLNQPDGVAVDGAGNVYIADTYNNAIKEWMAASNTVTTLVSSGLNSALWRGGGRRGQCLYRRHRQQRDQGMGGGQQHRHHAGVFGIEYPYGVAVDGAGNVYIADILEQRDQGMDGSQQHRHHAGVLGIDRPWRGGGRRGQCLHRRHWNNAIKEWMAASNTVTTLVSSGLNCPLAWRWTARAMSTSPNR